LRTRHRDQVLEGDAELISEDLGVVLAKPRGRPPQPPGCPPHPVRRSRNRHELPMPVLDVNEEPAYSEVVGVHDVVDAVDRVEWGADSSRNLPEFGAGTVTDRREKVGIKVIGMALRGHRGEDFVARIRPPRRIRGYLVEKHVPLSALN